MTNLLKVHAADESASEQATDTRAKLQVWADKHLPCMEPASIAPLDNDIAKGLRASGAAAVVQCAEWYSQQSEWAPQSQFAALLISLAGGTCAFPDSYAKETHNREISYMFEGAVREFHKQFFKAGMSWNTEAELLASLCFQVPHNTPAYADQIFQKQCGVHQWVRRNPMYSPRSFSQRDGNYFPDPMTLMKESRARFAGVGDWAMKAAFTQRELSGMSEGDKQGYWPSLLTGISSPLHFNYMEADGPWIAGFLNTEDAARLKFSRVRLGAYLATQGQDDTWVRSRVEKAKQRVAAASFEAYPNDTLWAPAYIGGVSSCMSNRANQYNTWDSIHPTDAYCSAYQGSGDNGLCLIITRDADGTVDGRGILNLQRGTIVRWYGSSIAERVLKRNNVETDDGDCLDGSWLALIQKEMQFIHPYNDGNFCYGSMDHGASRIYFCDDDDCVCIQDTSGSSYLLECKYCEDVDESRAEDECVWQAFHQNYVTNDATDAWACAVTGEWCHRNSRTTMEIHGVEVEVSDYFTQSRYQRSHLMELDSGGWGIKNDEMREQFYDTYEVDDSIEDEDDEDEDEEAA